MRNIISVEPFTKFSAEFLQSKLNKYKHVLKKSKYFSIDYFFIKLNFKDVDNVSIKSILSRIIQLKQFQPPSLAQLNPAEWKAYLGHKLVRKN